MTREWITVADTDVGSNRTDTFPLLFIKQSNWILVFITKEAEKENEHIACTMILCRH